MQFTPVTYGNTRLGNFIGGKSAKGTPVTIHLYKKGQKYDIMLSTNRGDTPTTLNLTRLDSVGIGMLNKLFGIDPIESGDKIIGVKSVA